MEGCLLVPPERGTIIGRAVWKQRFVVLGPSTRPSMETLPRSSSTNRLHGVRPGVRTAPSRLTGEESSRGSSEQQLWLSIYKHKGDWEALLQYPVTLIKNCEIQSIQHKKPGAIIPTLIVALNPDLAADKQRKRRSSRTGLSSSCGGSNPFPNSLLFRTIPDERFSIQDWQSTIQLQIPSNIKDESTVNMTSPTFNAFSDPFSGQPTNSDRRAGSGGISRPNLDHRASNMTYASTQSTRAPPTTLTSPSPSLRSRKSDLSSPASSMSRPQGYNPALPIQSPIDLPSPISILQYDDQFISGWTSAQGRSSTLSSHTRGSNSASMASTPPAPRETILDRAFMMRCIPGSDRSSKEEKDGEKVSSIARFEALMRDAEKKRKDRTNLEVRKDNGNGWELEEEDEESDTDSIGEEDIIPRRRYRYGSNNILEENELAVRVQEIPTPAQRALEYISGRTTPAIASRRPLSPTSSNIAPPLPLLADRALLRTSRRERPTTLTITTPSTAMSNLVEVEPSAANNPNRLSENSNKCLSFTEFARRLSSTSSLLLVQTNASSTSSRNSKGSCSEASFGFDTEESSVGVHRGLSQNRLSGMPVSSRGPTSTSAPYSGGERDVDKKCGAWKGSGLGVFGGEGGFL